jgi:hypothetical protein
MPASNDFDPRLWEVDLASHRVTHASGFTARVCAIPMGEAELRELNAEGLVAISTLRSDNGAKWAVLANSESIDAAERWAASQSATPTRERGVSVIARHAGQAWLRLHMPPPTVDDTPPLRPLYANLR